MSTTTIRVKSADKLVEHITSLENDTLTAANEQGVKMQSDLTINGKAVRCTVTPPAKPGRKPYTLFYVEERRTPKTALQTVLLAA